MTKATPRIQLEDSAHLIHEPDGVESVPVIERFVDEGDKIILVGPPGAGKSILTQQIAMCIATATPFLDCLTVPKRRRVLYLNAEGKVRDMKKRLKRMGMVIPLEDEGLMTWGFAGNFAVDSDQGRLEIEHLIEVHQPEVVVYDPLYMSMLGSLSDEKDARVVQAVFNHWALRYGITQLVPTHPPKPVRGADAFASAIHNDDSVIFGSRFWEAWADLTMSLKQRPDHHHELKVMKDKTGERVGGFFRDTILLSMVQPVPLIFDTACSPFTNEEGMVMLGGDVWPVATSKVWVWVKMVPGLTRAELCDRTKLSERSVDVALERLEAENVIKRQDYPGRFYPLFRHSNHPPLLDTRPAPGESSGVVGRGRGKMGSR